MLLCWRSQKRAWDSCAEPCDATESRACAARRRESQRPNSKPFVAFKTIKYQNSIQTVKTELQHNSKHQISTPIQFKTDGVCKHNAISSHAGALVVRELVRQLLRRVPLSMRHQLRRDGNRNGEGSGKCSRRSARELRVPITARHVCPAKRVLVSGAVGQQRGH